MPNDQTIYLIKNGKTFGPFSQVEIDAFRTKEELTKFDWICYNLKQGWVPVAPPATIPELVEKSAEPVTQKQMATSSSTEKSNISVLCHGRETILSGTLKDINAEGCTLTRISPASKTIPQFLGGTHVRLNLLNSETSQAENVDAQVTAIHKNKGFWDYRLKWEILPSILK